MNRLHNSGYCKQSPRSAAAKTTGTYSDWYDQANQNFTTGTSLGYYNLIFPDSNLYDATNSIHVRTHGMGNSFDPTDSSYFDFSVNSSALVTPVGHAMRQTNQIYTIDSYYAPIQYLRHDASSNDSLILEFVVASNWTNDSGAYNLRFNASAGNAVMCHDSTPRFSTIHYNSGQRTGYTLNPYINDCYFDSVFAPKQRYAFALNSTTYGDTDANGYLLLGALPGNMLNYTTGSAITTHAGLYSLPITPITIDPTTGLNPHLVAFISFKSGHAGNTYPFNTNVSSANLIKTFTEDPSGIGSWFMQSSHNATNGYGGSYQSGCVVYNTQRYTDTFFTWPVGKHEILIPGWAFTGPGYVVTEQGYHVTWTGVASGVTTTNEVFNVNAYPNPANNVLNVTFDQSQANETTVSLTNMIGQVVATRVHVTDGKATFNTAALPSGMYIYSIQAGGENTTGHVVIAH